MCMPSLRAEAPVSNLRAGGGHPRAKPLRRAPEGHRRTYLNSQDILINMRSQQSLSVRHVLTFDLQNAQVAHADKHAIKDFDRKLKVEVCPPDRCVGRMLQYLHSLCPLAHLRLSLRQILQVQDKAKAAGIEAVIPPR